MVKSHEITMDGTVACHKGFFLHKLAARLTLDEVLAILFKIQPSKWGQ
jgi:hypothetical protein